LKTNKNPAQYGWVIFCELPNEEDGQADKCSCMICIQHIHVFQRQASFGYYKISIP
jgi:hypothetical protein